jgi:hypothetical protein
MRDVEGREQAAIIASPARSISQGARAPFASRAQARLAVAFGGAALAGWPVILAQLEQGWLFGAGCWASAWRNATRSRLT